MSRRHSSREKYRGFIEDFKRRRLDDETGQGTGAGASAEVAPKPDAALTDSDKQKNRAKRRAYVREYLRWLKPHRTAVVVMAALALVTAGLQLVEPLFMRFIIDRVLLNAALDSRRTGGAAQHGGRRVSDGHRAVQSDQRPEGLPPAPAQRADHAGAPARAVQPAAALAAGQALRHEDGRHPLAPHRRRRDDVRAHADGDRLAVDFDHPAGRGDRRAARAQLAAGAHRAGDRAGRDGDQLHVLEAHPAHLPVVAQGRGAHRRPGRRDVFRHSRRARVRPRDAGAGRVHARPPHGAAQGAVRAAPRNGAVDVVGLAPRRGQRRHRLVRRIPERRRSRIDRRHHGVPVVHVPAAQSGLADRQLVFGAAAVAGGDGARVRSAGDGGRQAGPAGCPQRTGRRGRDPLRGRVVRVSRRAAGRSRLERDRARRIGHRAGRPKRGGQDDRDRPGGPFSRPDARPDSRQRRRHS